MAGVLNVFYWLAGIVLAFVAFHTYADATHPRRWTSGTFWLLFAFLFLAGDRVPPAAAGVAVLAMALLAGLRFVTPGSPEMPDESVRRLRAATLGNRLFVPALAIPLVTLVCSLTVHAANAAFIGLGAGCVIAWILACIITRDTPAQSLRESRRLLDTLGWAAVLPQMLAMLGLLFTTAGVGGAVAHLVSTSVDTHRVLVAVAVFAVGMALFTMAMGNAFAAFPIVVGGVGIPALVGQHHADPAMIAAIGMFSGYCGTLMTPMAANFNIVPAALLELKDQNAVIKAQVGTALPLLAFNIVLLYVLLR